MKIVIEASVHTEGLEKLINSLEICQFTDACCLGAIDSNLVYLRCPNTKHGVILNRSEITDASINWAIDALKNSVAINL